MSGRRSPSGPGARCRSFEAGIDLGSVSVKAVALDADGRRVAAVRRPIRGRLRETADAALAELELAVPGPFTLIAVTGSRAERIAQLLGISEISSIVAAHRGAACLVPEAGAALELGGESARFLRFGPPGADGVRELLDFEVNAACSAGTGAFLEQEAHRFGLTLEDMGRRAAASRSEVRIAGRCAVFAKTDAVHKHQNGVPLDDIAWALCQAVAQGVCAELVGDRPFERPLALIGGVAANPAVRRALLGSLDLAGHELTVPPEHEFASAIGATLVARARPGHAAIRPRLARERLAADPAEPPSVRRLPPLSAARGLQPVPNPRSGVSRSTGDEVLGVDIGSTSTNAVLLGPDGMVLEALSGPTRGDPLRAVVSLLERLEAARGALRPRAVGVTGSGRRLAAELLGADFTVNEITAHAEGCVRFHPDADTVFDIGGQDAKYIRLASGAVVGFEMNKVCSAGTGSFLEEMAALLGLDIVGEFEREALRSRAPQDLGERCTVFMASEVARRLQEGAAREDLAAGLAYAVVRNYLSRVVSRNPVGRRVVFQGGVAANAAVVSAIQSLLGRTVAVHPWNETAGAIGVASLAARHVSGQSRFRGGAALESSRLQLRGFTCPRCENRCTVHVTRTSDGGRCFAGGLCDRYEGRGRTDSPAPLDLLAERESALAPWLAAARPDDPDAIGVPRALLFHDQLPFWSAFLESLDIPFKLSAPTGPGTLERGGAIVRRGTCLPLRIAYGHTAELMESGCRRVLIPSMASRREGTAQERLSHACPAVQGWPYTTRALLGGNGAIVAPRMRLSLSNLERRDVRNLGSVLGHGARRTRAAYEAGLDAQRSFREAMLRRGDEVLAERSGIDTVALLARPYAMFDEQLRLRLSRVLADAGLVAMPMEMLRDEPAPSEALHGMYWHHGKRMLQVARKVRSLGDLPVIVLSSFGCGPDAFILHMLRRELGPVPTLELEVDEHSEFNGIHTRVEAFRWALGTPRDTPPRAPEPPGAATRSDLKGRRLQLPWMSDHAVAVAAAFRSCGVDASVLPPPDEESIALGRDALDGGECLPCSFILGDMLRCLENGAHGSGRESAQGAELESEPDPAAAFFMITGDGPCRLGQYPWLHRAVLDARGYADVPIFNASQDPKFYEHFALVPAEFRRRAWGGVVATDLLYRKWRSVRSRAKDREAVDRAYQNGLGDLERALECGSRPDTALVGAFDRLEAEPANGTVPAVTIAVLGENYIRCNSVANAGLAEELERLGAEVWFPSLCEWVMYTNWTARLHCRYERQPRRMLGLLAIDTVQRRDITRISRAVRGRLPDTGFPTVHTLLRLAEPYVPRTFEGETVWGIGRTIDFSRRGIGGVIHVAPFSCMVGGIVESLCHRVSEDLGGFPLLHLKYDGRPGENAAGLLEGFVLRARAWQERSGGGIPAVRRGQEVRT